MRERVVEWKATAELAQREYPGWWRRIEEQSRRGKGTYGATPARMAVAAHIVASYEAVPAMADMLMSAAEIIAAGERGETRSDQVRAWLCVWRGEG